MWDLGSLTKQTHVPYIARWILHHRASREVPWVSFWAGKANSSAMSRMPVSSVFPLPHVVFALRQTVLGGDRCASPFVVIRKKD